MDNLIKKEQKLKEMITKDKRNIKTYNSSLSKQVNTVTEVNGKYETRDSLKPFSWQLYEIDRDAIEDFRRAHDCSYQDIIKYALRFYLSETNYRHAAEIVELRKRHDNEGE